MKKYILFIKKYAIPLRLLLVALVLLSIVGITRIKISSDFRIFVPEVSIHQEKLDYMNEHFPSSDQIIVMIPLKNGLDRDAYLSLQKIHQYLDSDPEVLRYLGPAPASIEMAGNSLTIQADDPASLLRLQTYFDLMGQMSPIVTSQGQTYGSFTIFISENYSASQVHQLEDVITDQGFTYYATGDNYMQFLIFDYILTILKFIPPIALFFVLLIFGIQLQSLKATFLSILPAGLGALTTLGFVGWLGKEVSIVTVLAPVFTIVIGSADGLHFISHVQDEERNGHDNITGLTSTLRMVGLPMIITTVTSIAGFMALLTMNTSAIVDLAVFASVGILFAGLITWYVLPLILVGNVRLHGHSPRKPMNFNFLKKLWGLPSLGLLGAVLLIFILGFSQIQTEFNMLMVYKESTDIYKSAAKIQEINQGSIPLYLYMDIDGELLSSDNAEKFQHLTNELEKEPYIGKVVSPYDIVQILSGVLMPGTDTYPSDPMVQSQIQAMLASNEDSPLNNLMNFDQGIVKIIVFPKDLNNETLNKLVAFIDDYNAHHQMTIEVTGIQYLLNELNDSMFSNQLTSTGLAMVIVFLLLLLALRKAIPALISLVPISLTMVFLFGFLGLSGISLNIMTTTIFSITVGVGIDYAIHFTSVFIHLKKDGLTGKELIDKTYAYTARPIIANALGLSFGLSALFISPLAIHTNVATLMWVTMLSSVLFSLTFLPTLLKKTI